jgi:hypothetical protein
MFVQARIPNLTDKALDKGNFDRLAELDEVEGYPMLRAHASNACPENSGPLSSTKTSGNERSAKSRSRVRHNKSAPNRAVHLDHLYLFRARIYHREALEPPAIGQPAMHKVHRITESRPGRYQQRDARDRCGFLPRPAAQREPFLSIETLDLGWMTNHKNPSQPRVDAMAPAPSLRLRNCSNPLPQHMVVQC